MSFAQPWLLLGLLGTAAPIIIHLIHRSRPRKQPFPALELLMRSAQRVESRMRLRRLLLLAMRILVLAALAFAAAGPLIGADRDQARLALDGPERIALVVDTSLSMRASYGGQSAFSRAIDEARARVARLGPEDVATIIAAEKPPRILLERPTADRGALGGALERLEPSWTPGSLAEAVSFAADALAEREPSKTEGQVAAPARIIVLSDLTRPALDGAANLDVPGVGTATLEVPSLLDGVADRDRVNFGFVSSASEPAPGEGPRTMKLISRLQAHEPSPSKEPTPIDLSLSCGESEIAKSSVDVASGGVTERSFVHVFAEAGVRSCTFSIEDDALRADNRAFLSVDVREQVRTLVVDGQPSGVPKEDEAFYLQHALAAGATDQPAPVTISADDLTLTDLDAFDTVILAGVPTLGRTEGDRLVRHVREGGGLLITMAEGLDPSAYSGALGPILPRALRGLKSEDGSGFELLESPDLGHPVLAPFGGEALGGLLSTRTHSYMLLEPGGPLPMQTLLRLRNGAPVLVASDVGAGRVMLLTTSIDRDLGDLAIRPAFVPLMRQIILWLGKALAGQRPIRLLVGDAHEVTLPKGTEEAAVSGPDGRTYPLELDPESPGSARFRRTTVPGHYTVRARRDGEWSEWSGGGFSVNVDSRESDLVSVAADEAGAILRGEAAPATGDGGARTVGGTFSSGALSTLLLFVMAAAFFLESILGAVLPRR